MVLPNYSSAIALALLTLIVIFPRVARPEESAEPVAETKYDLRYKFRPGEELRWRVRQSNAIETTIQGFTERSDSRSLATKIWTVTHSGVEGQIMFLHTVDDVDMWQRVGDRPEVRFNSQTDKEPPAEYAKVQQDLGKVLTTMTINDRGRILDRKDHRVVPKSVRESHGMVLPLPEEPVPVGYVWTMPREIEVRDGQNVPRMIQTRHRYTLEKVKNGVATIKVEFQVLSPISDPAIEANLISESGDGYAKFDIDHGRVISQRLDLDKRVIGFQGPASVIHYVGRIEDEFSEVTNATAKRPLATTSRQSGGAF